jgi:hypothetical protein
MKFKSDIEVQAGLKDSSGAIGASGQLLSSTSSGVSWTSLNGFVPYVGATANVNLGTHTLLAAKGVFSSSGSGNTVEIGHPSGSGIALNITKGGNGEGLYINKTSGSGNAVTIIGTLNATTLVKAGGTSSQYLMADGSVSTSVTARTETLFTATAGQTTFTVNYTVGQLDVYYNGAKLSPSEFTATNGTSITLGFACAAGEVISVITYNTQITGASGTTNRVAKFTGPASLGDSQIFDNGTNVGIGTTSPSQKLVVNGRIRVTTNNSDGGDMAVDDGGLSFSTNNSTAPITFKRNNYSAESMRITSTGNVGIGTTSALTKLHIEGDNSSTTDETVLTLRGNGENGKRIDFRNAFGSLARITGTKLGGGPSADEGILTFETATNSVLSENMRITASGNVGIGTTSPATKLHIGGVGSALSFDTTGLAASTILSTVEDFKFSIKNNRGTSSEIKVGNDNLEFLTNTAERMRITSGGSVLLGTTDTGFNARQLIRFEASGASTRGLAIWNGGGDGSVYAAFANSSGGFTGTITQAAFGASYNTTSDYRLKEDLKPIKGLELISKIKVYDFKWKDHTDRMDGVIAHELQEVVPYAVTGKKDAEEMQQVDYSKLVPILIQSIKELTERIKILENK